MRPRPRYVFIFRSTCSGLLWSIAHEIRLIPQPNAARNQEDMATCGVRLLGFPSVGEGVVQHLLDVRVSKTIVDVAPLSA